MQNLKDDQIRHAVRKTYGQIAKNNTAGCGCSPSSCYSSTDSKSAEDISINLGYSNEDVSSVPDGANMGLGCGNPQKIASLRKGEVVLDLGSGGGFDCFLAAKAVGDTGFVIGVDMTPEMISKARENAVKAQLHNVEFRLGEIEHLPVADNSVDVIISNCVINLSPEKINVFKESFRILKPGGRLAITDVVATSELPDEAKKSLELYSGCVTGAALIADLKSILEETGFSDISIKPIEESRESIRQWFKDSHVADFVISATIEAIKP